MNTRALGILLGSMLLVAARAAPLTPAQVVDRLEARLGSVGDYQCVMESDIAGEKDRQKGTYRIWFRKPDLIRIKVERGSHRGSEISVTRRGSVRAHGGGLLKPIVTTMKKTDSRLKDPRGSYAWESDFGTYYRKVREKLAAAEKAEVKPVPGSPDRLVMEITYRDPEHSRRLYEVWTVDSANWLLLKDDLYEDDRQVARVEFRDYRENTGLKEEFFDL